MLSHNQKHDNQNLTFRIFLTVPDVANLWCCGSPPGENLRIATRLRELLSCSEFRNGTWWFHWLFKIGRSRNQVSSRCSRAPFNERPWWRYAMNSVETSDLQCLPFIQFSYSNEIFISPCFLWWIHAYTDLVSRTDTIMTVLSWLHHIILWWLINMHGLYIF